MKRLTEQKKTVKMSPYEYVCPYWKCIFHSVTADMNCSHGYQNGVDNCPHPWVELEEENEKKS